MHFSKTLALATLLSLAGGAPVADLSGGLEHALNKTKEVFHDIEDEARDVFNGTGHGATWPVAHGRQSCTATELGVWVSYSINIGVDFDESRCPTLKKALQARTNPVLDILFWKCVDDGSGKMDGKSEGGLFRLWFNAVKGREQVLNEVLTDQFPNIDGFNCPDQ